MIKGDFGVLDRVLRHDFLIGFVLGMDRGEKRRLGKITVRLILSSAYELPYFLFNSDAVVLSLKQLIWG